MPANPSTPAHRLGTNEICTRLAAFARNWQHAYREEADAQIFTLRFLECFGLSEHHYVREGKVPKADGSSGYMDGYIPGKFIIEFKSLGKNLEQAARQADAYRWGCKPHEQPRHILLCDFQNFLLLDLKTDTPYRCTRAELSTPKVAEKFRFLIDDPAPATPQEETQADREAAESMAALHQAMLADGYSGRDLETFLTRLLFCFFADDTAIFGNNDLFSAYILASNPDGSDLGARLLALFQTLNRPENQRGKNLDHAQNKFPYINGKLFEDKLDIPSFNSALYRQIVQTAQLDWSKISPAIFGAMFQGVLEKAHPDASRTASRRELGAHYTSERNILRAINPLFMDDLRDQLKAAGKNRTKLQTLHDKIAALKIFDPACGCGNFLVIAFRELRRLEYDLIRALYGTNLASNKGIIETYIRICVDQFYGIEIDQSAAHIAQVALWIADHQLNMEAQKLFGAARPSIPLKQSAHIHCGNALRTNWAELLPPAQCSYIVGNPPFVGAKYQSAEQRADVALVMGHIPNCGLLDYVACWHVKAAAYMQANAAICTALVSTNSICQGEQVGVLWPHMLAHGLHIHFAHRTFQWSNEGKGVAAVHCIIVGYGKQPPAQPVIFDYSSNIKSETGERLAAQRINPYLVDAPDVVLARRSKPLCDVPEMVSGNKPIDDGNYLFTAEEYAAFIQAEPASQRFFRRWLGGEEFINGTERWCLWLGDANPAELVKLPECRKRIEAVRRFRASSKSKPTQALAATPRRFHTEFVSGENYLAMPQVSSERRRFIPIAFLNQQYMCGDKLRLVSNATFFHFGVMTSSLHMAWMRAVCGRLESRYQYSAKIVYNNYPWPQNPTDKQRQAVETAAQCVLDARALYPQATLADLYDPLTMPAELVKAHTALDRAVDAAYTYKGNKDDPSRTAFLFAQYQQLVGRVG